LASTVAGLDDGGGVTVCEAPGRAGVGCSPSSFAGVGEEILVDTCGAKRLTERVSFEMRAPYGL
jgi:hypothetical protein